jgi:cytoskeleton protein RodZ
MVGVDPESLGLDQSPSQPQAASQLKPTPAAIGEITREVDHNGSGVARWLVPGLLVAALAAGIAFYQGGTWFGWDVTKLFATTASPPTIKSAVAAKAETAAEPATAKSNPLASSSGAVIGPAAAAAAPTPAVVAPSVAADAVTGSLSPSVVTTPPAPGAVPAVIPDTAATSAAALPVTSASAPLAAGEKRISVLFKGKSWTEVRSRGDVIFSETAVPGLREFSGKPPLSFIVGNASNVVVTIDGKPFDMADLTRNDVARFRVE